MSIFAMTLSAKEYTVKMLNVGSDGKSMVFEPAVLNVAAGDVVKFIATDQGHNTLSAYIPNGAKPWQSEISKDFVVTFDKEGVYFYECEPHLVLGMVGIINVGNKLNKDEVNTNKAKLLNSILTPDGKQRLEDYVSSLPVSS